MCKISIIVPVYNSSKYLKKCLDSLINQTLKDIEIIMINDGSTDNSENIIRKYQKKDKRIKLINKENGGQASARNLGLKEANGEYISFVDSDDYIALDLCEKTYQKAIEKEYDIIVFDYYITDNVTNTYSKMLNTLPSGSISSKDFFFSAAGPWNKIYKKDFLIRNNFSFPLGIIYEDYASIIPLVKYNPTIYYLNQAYYYYFQSSESTMRNSEYNVKYEDIFKANDIIVSSLKDTIYKEELEYLVSYHMLYLGSLNFYKYKKFEQIDRISDFIKNNFPYWYRNKYVKKIGKKEKILSYLFYRKKYKFIRFIQNVKKLVNHER